MGSKEHAVVSEYVDVTLAAVQARFEERDLINPVGLVFALLVSHAKTLTTTAILSTGSTSPTLVLLINAKDPLQDESSQR